MTSTILEEIDSKNVKALYRKFIGLEKISEYEQIKTEFEEFRNQFEDSQKFDEENPEFQAVLKRNDKNIKKYKEAQRKMYEGILG